MNETKHNGNISNSYEGYFQESIVRNLSEHPLYVMDEHGEEIIIEPDSNASSRARNQIVVMMHSTNGSRVGPSGPKPKQYTSRVYNVEEVHTPVHIEDLAIVMTIDRSANLSAFHPNSRVEYNKVLAEVSKKMEASISTASISFVVNDPLGRFSELYVAIDDTIPFPIPVTNCPGKQEMTLVVRHDGLHNNLLGYDISSIADNEYIFVDGAVSVGLGINSAAAKKAHESMTRRRNDKIQVEVTKRMEAERKNHAKELDAERNACSRKILSMKEDNELSIRTYSKKIDVLTSKIDCLVNEKSTLETKLKSADEWKNLYQARSEDVTTKNKETEQHHKTVKAEVQTRGEILKQAFGVAKYAIPVVVTIGGFMFATRE